jgi:hypothetical protein
MMVQGRGGMPPSVVKSISQFLRKMLATEYRPPVGKDTISKWKGSSDASATPQRSGIGGWISDMENPQKEQVWWFMVELKEDTHHWIFAHADKMRRVAAEELFGTLILFDEIRKKQKDSTEVRLVIPMATDNQGNAISILNEKTKRWPSSLIMMQLVWEAHKHNMELAVRHTVRETNTWADRLAAGDSEGFDPALRLRTTDLASDWDIIKQFTTSEHIAAFGKLLKRKQKDQSKRSVGKSIKIRHG